jgi:hypothetical protein
MKTEIDDPIVAEVRRARHEISAEHGHDTRRLVEHYIKMQDAAKKMGKYRFVTEFYSTSPEKKKLAKAHK